MSEVYFRYNGDPVAKPRMTQRDKWAKRPAVLRYRDYCDRLRELCPAIPPNGSLEVRMLFWMPMPKSWSAKKKELHASFHHHSKPDVDNLAKGVLDALFVDDSRVWRITAEKRWHHLPGVHVWVEY